MGRGVVGAVGPVEPEGVGEGGIGRGGGHVVGWDGCYDMREGMLLVHAVITRLELYAM